MATAAPDTVSGYQILLDKELGSGSFGTVLEAVNTESGEVVAVKKITRTGSGNFAKTASREAVNFQRLPNDHENLIKVLDVKYMSGSLYIFMEKCDAGDLNKYFRTNFAAIDIKLKIKLMSHISAGLSYLHSQRIVHRDIKPANVLIKIVSGQPVAKITDFGLSKFLGPEDTSLMTSDVGTAAFMAPEFWNKGDDGKISYRSSVDVFAAGLLYLAMLQATEGAKLRPSAEESVGGSTEGSKHIGLVMHMRSTLNQPTLTVVAARPRDSDNIKKLKKMIRNMISFNPEERPKAADVDRLLKAIVTLMEFEDSSADTTTLDEHVEDTPPKPFDVSISKVNQWKLEHHVQWMHVTKNGHIYTVNPFGQIDLRDLSGRLLYQWSNVKLKGITSVTIDKTEYLAIVVNGENETGTAIKVKTTGSRSQTSDSWNVTAYECPLESDVQTPLAKLQNGCIAVGLKRRKNGDMKSQVHILDCSTIPFICTSTIDIETGSMRALCGLLSDTGEQLIACVTEFDGIKRPVVVYSVTSKEEVWQFTGQNIEEFKTRGVLDEVMTELKEHGDNQRSQKDPLSSAIHSLMPGVQQTNLGPFFPQLEKASLPFASTVGNLDLAPVKHKPVVSMDLFLNFLATDLCAISEHKIFIAEGHNQEMLLADSSGKMLSKVLTKEELGTFAVDYMQCLLPSQYLITICTPRPITGLVDQIMIVWRLKIK